MTPDDFDALTFDCYGTLIDWETGMLAALRPLLDRRGLTPTDDAILERFAAWEAEVESEPYLPYREVLREVTRRWAGECGFAPDDEEADALAESLPHWPPFADTVDALTTLARRYRLGIISNVDDDLFAGTARRLGVPFDFVVTASQVKSYKPAPAHFLAALNRLERSGVRRDRILHVAQSLHHDIAPARALGLATVWVNRRMGQPGSGATLPASAAPDMEVPDLRTLAAWAAASCERFTP